MKDSLQSRPFPRKDALTDHLIELELRLQRPETRQDPPAVADLLSDEFREFGASGSVWDRAGIVALLAVEVPSIIVSDQFTCTRVSSDVALLTYRATTPGGTASHTTWRSSLWRLEGERWRMLFHQGTLIPRDQA